jgi:hypothetical protein
MIIPDLNIKVSISSSKEKISIYSTFLFDGDSKEEIYSVEEIISPDHIPFTMPENRRLELFTIIEKTKNVVSVGLDKVINRHENERIEIDELKKLMRKYPEIKSHD